MIIFHGRQQVHEKEGHKTDDHHHKEEEEERLNTEVGFWAHFLQNVLHLGFDFKNLNYFMSFNVYVFVWTIL